MANMELKFLHSRQCRAILMKCLMVFILFRALGSFKISEATQKVSSFITPSNCFRFPLPIEVSSLNKSSTYLEENGFESYCSQQPQEQVWNHKSDILRRLDVPEEVKVSHGELSRHLHGAELQQRDLTLPEEVLSVLVWTQRLRFHVVLQVVSAEEDHGKKNTFQWVHQCRNSLVSNRFYQTL